MAQKVYDSTRNTCLISVGDELELVCTIHKGKVGFKPREVYVWDLDESFDWHIVRSRRKTLSQSERRSGFCDSEAHG